MPGDVQPDALLGGALHRPVVVRDQGAMAVVEARGAGLAAEVDASGISEPKPVHDSVLPPAGATPTQVGPACRAKSQALLRLRVVDLPSVLDLESAFGLLAAFSVSALLLGDPLPADCSASERLAVMLASSADIRSITSA